VALLRTCQPDARRALVLQALDTLTPALVRRLEPGDARFPTWVRYTKKVLVEEGASLPHLVHIWQLIVRHAPLFYSSRRAPALRPSRARRLGFMLRVWCHWSALSLKA